MSWRPRWYLKNVEYQVTETGVKIIVYTDVACHLWLRWTTTEPRIHLDPVLKRGVPFRNMPRYCFTKFHENEQEEAFDTHLHTFTKEPWSVCETRWFYLFGTIDSVSSPSESPLLHYHRGQPPITQIFYPDKHPEVTSVDGFAEAVLGGTVSWETLRQHDGTGGQDQASNLNIGFKCQRASPNWWWLTRSIALFDTTIIPITATILEAILSPYAYARKVELGNPSLNVYRSYPDSNIALVPTDYQKVMLIPFSESKLFADIPLNVYTDFPLNPAGLQAIMKAGITKLGFREATYDVPNIEPPWGSWKESSIYLASAEYTPDRRVKLSVTWKE